MKRPTRKRSLTRPSLTFIAGITILALVALITLDAYYLNWSWTGFGPKTLWDWLDLLIIPIVLAAGGLWFSRQEKRYEQQIAENRSQDEAVQAYLDKMTELLLKEDLRNSTEPSEARLVARARTLTVLRRLDRERRIVILQFLGESNLINAENPIINMVGSQFNQYDLSLADLSFADFRQIDLSFANLHGANLQGTDLRHTNLHKANLHEANLGDADLRYTDLHEANLTGAILTRANLTGADLTGADLTGAFLDEYARHLANLTQEQLSQVQIVPTGAPIVVRGVTHF